MSEVVDGQSSQRLAGRTASGDSSVQSRQHQVEMASSRLWMGQGNTSRQNLMHHMYIMLRLNVEPQRPTAIKVNSWS